MKGQAIGLTEETARRLQLLLGDRGDAREIPRKRPQGRAVSLVRCDSATAAGGSGAAAQCYPATILLDEADATAQTDGGPVWLTVWDEAGDAATPTAGKTYPAVLAGYLEIGGDSYQRAFSTDLATVGEAGGGGVALDYGYDDLASDYTLTDTSSDTGVELTLAAGTWLLTYNALGYHAPNQAGAFITCQLYDVTAGTGVYGSATNFATAYQVTSSPTYSGRGAGTCTILYTAPASRTIRLQAQRSGASSWTSSYLSLAHTHLTAVRIA